jgi:hypothetical protein
MWPVSYFEGHYLVLQPPIFWKPMPGWWVRLVFGRDPAFAATLQTQVNPVWCRRMAGKAAKKYPLELISVGDEPPDRACARPLSDLPAASAENYFNAAGFALP